MNSIYERTSVRAYQPCALQKEEIKQILKAAFCAPSARNAQPWYFIVVEDKAKLEQLSHFSPYASFLKDAAMGIVVCADLSRNPSFDYCQQDCAAATQNMLLEAKELGIGTCWLGGHPNEDRVEFLKNALQIKEPLFPLWMISFGYPAQPEVIKDKWDPAKIRFE